MKRVLLFFAVVLSASAQQLTSLRPSISVGLDAPAASACERQTVGNIYVRSENSSNGPIHVLRCTQIGALTYAWQPIGHFVGATLPTKCTVGDIAFDTSASAGSNINGCTTTNTWTAQAGGSGGSMTYPGAGVGNSTGSAWGTSYTVGTSASNLVQLNGSAQLPAISAALLTNFPTLNQDTTGTAANVSGTVIPANGGTGLTSYTIGDLVYASGGTTLSKLLGVATGNVLISGGVATAPSWGKVTSSHVNNTIALTGTDINTSNQVTVTHLAVGLPRAQGGLNSTSAGTGIIRDGTTPTASELSGDATTSGSNVVTVVKVNGITISGTPASGYVPTATSSSAATWQAQGAGHTQNTDTGTTSDTFQIGSSSSGPILKRNSTSLQVRNAADSADEAIEALAFNAPTGTAFQASGATEAAPTVTVPTFYFDVTAGLGQYLNASSVLSGTMVAPDSARTANQFCTHVSTAGVCVKAALASGDIPNLVNPSLGTGASSISRTTTAGTGGVTAKLLAAKDTSDPTRRVLPASGGCGAGIAATTATVGNTFELYVVPGTVITGVADNAITAGHVLVGGTTTPGRVKDSGQTSRTAIAPTTCIVGVALVGASAGADVSFEYDGPGTYGSAGTSGGGTTTLQITETSAADGDAAVRSGGKYVNARPGLPPRAVSTNTDTLSCSTAPTGDNGGVVDYAFAGATTVTVPAAGGSCPVGTVIWLSNTNTTAANAVTLATGFTGTVSANASCRLRVDSSSAWSMVCGYKSAQGNSGKPVMAGTVSGTAATLCTDASGNATTSGCTAGTGVVALTRAFGENTTLTQNATYYQPWTRSAMLTTTCSTVGVSYGMPVPVSGNLASLRVSIKVGSTTSDTGNLTINLVKITGTPGSWTCSNVTGFQIVQPINGLFETQFAVSPTTQTIAEGDMLTVSITTPTTYTVPANLQIGWAVKITGAN